MVRNLARLVALAAIAAVAVSVYVIVQANVATHSSSAAHAHDGHHRRRHHRHAAGRPKPTFYTVQAGDTLSEIAHKTGVALTQIETLNPSLNPNALQTGQRLRLRR